MGIYDETPEADLVLEHIEKLYKKNSGGNIFVIGLSGTGKSSTCFRFAELRRNSFPERNLKIFIVDSLLKLLEAVRSAKDGDIIVIEEVSVLFPSRRAMAGDNVAVGKIFDTIRKKRLCIISNAPLWDTIDKHMKSMAHILIETLRINRTEKVVISKFHRIQTNPKTGKIYQHTLQRNGRDVHRMITRMPSKEIWSEYEQEKDKFMEELYEELRHKENLKRNKLMKEMGKTKAPMRDLTPRELQVHTLYNVNGLTLEQVGKKLNISASRVGQIKQNIEKKTLNTKENQHIKVESQPKQL